MPDQDPFAAIAQPVESQQAATDPFAAIAKPIDQSPHPLDQIATPVNPPAPVNPHAITAQVSANNPSLLDTLKSTVRNGPIGRSLQSTMPKVASALGLDPTQTEAEQQRTAGQSDEVVNLRPLVENASGTGMRETAQQQLEAGNPLTAAAIYGASHLVRQDSTQERPLVQRFGTGVAGAASGMTTPGNAAIMAATGGLGEFAAGAPIVGRLISAGFSVQMLKGLYEQAPQFKAAIDRKDYGAAAEIAGQMAATGVMAGMAGKHALKGAGVAPGDTAAPPPPKPFTPEVGAQYIQQVRAGVHPAEAAASLDMTPEHQELAHVANFIDPAMADKVAPPPSDQVAPSPIGDPNALANNPEYSAIHARYYKMLAGANPDWGVSKLNREAFGMADAKWRATHPEDAPAAPQQPSAPPSAPEVQANAQMTEVTRLAAAAQGTQVQAEQLTGMRPPPPPKPQVPLPDGLRRGELTRQTVDNAGTVIQTAPPEQQGQLKVAAANSFAKWLTGQKAFVDPDGKIVNVEGDTQDAISQSARKIATKIINDEVDRQAEAAQAKADAAQKQAEEQAKQQEEDRKTAEEERVAARQDAGAGKAPLLAPDTPQYNAVRQALDRTDVNTPAEKLDEVVRKAAGMANLPMTPEMRATMVQEHLGRRQQQETSAVQGEPVKPGQSPAELNAWHEDVKSGIEPFMHVAQVSNFKPKDRKGLTTTRVSGVENADGTPAEANGTYYHAKDIKPTDIKEAARTGKLDQLAADWKARQATPATHDAQVVAPDAERGVKGITLPVTNEPPPAEEVQPVELPQDQPRTSHPDVEVYRKALAEGKSPEEASDAVAAAQGGEPEEEELAVKSGESGTLAAPEKSGNTERKGVAAKSPEPAGGGEAAPAVEKTEETSQPEKRAPFKPGDKVQIKNADGTTRDGVLRFKNPNGKWVLKGERKAVPEGDISNVGDGGKPIAANDQQGAEGGTGGRSGQDSSLQSQGERSASAEGFPNRLAGRNKFREDSRQPSTTDAIASEGNRSGEGEAAGLGDGTSEGDGRDSIGTAKSFDPNHPEAGFLDLSDLANAVEPLREALEKRVDVAEVAGTVHDTLQNLDRTNKATTLQMKDTVRAMADPKFSHEDGEQVFKNLEDPSVPLTANQIELRDKYVKPLNAATRADYITTQLIKSGKFSLDDILAGKVPPEEIAKVVPDQENYQHRVAVGKDTLVERLIGETAKKFGALGGKLARTFSSEKTRTLREIHGPDGEREAVAVKGDRVIQFVNKDNAGVLDDKIATVKDQLAKEKASKSPDEERLDNLQRQIDGLNEQKQTVADGGHTTIDMGPHKAGFVTTKDLADEAAAPLEKKLAEMENEFHLLHGSQARVRASTNRITNLYDKIDETEKQIAAIRASIGPEEEAKTGLTDDELLGQQKTDIEALQKRVAKFEARQTKLQATEGRSPAQERELKNIPGRIEETNDQIAEIKDSAISQGLEGKYWRDKNGGLWKFDQGTADFISQRTGQEYFTDARMAGLANHLEVNKAMNAAVALEHTKTLLEDRGMGIKVENKANAPEGWKPTTLPQFRDYYFPEHIADALDQFHYKKLGGQDVLQQVNGFLMQTILMNPLMHIPNVAMNALVGKAAEFFSGKGLDPSWYADNMKAGLKAVNVLKDLGGKEYQHLLRVGLDLRGSDSSFDATMKDIMRQWTDQLKDNPEHNAAMSALLKVKDAAQFIQKMQHQVTFGANDAFTLQSFYAKRAELIRKGMDTDTAEAAARDYVHLKGVGEYTTPVQLAGSSTLGRLADNPLVNAFWHYHYGYLIKPLMTAISDAVGPDDLRFKADEDASAQTGRTVNKMGETANQQRAVAVARLAFLTLFATTIKPLLDKAAKKLTGNPRAEAPDGGQTALVSSAAEAYKDEHNVGKGVLSAATTTAGRLFIPSPIARDAVGLIGNYDTFLGRHVRNPNDDVSEQGKQVGAWLMKGTYPAQLQVGSGGGGWQKPLEKFLGFKFPLHDGIKAATEIRSDERGKLPSDTVKSRTFQAIMAAAEQSHHSGGQDTSLADALYESGQLSKAQEKELGQAIQDPPIVFAVGGLRDADVYHVFQRSNEQERADLLSDDKVYAKMDKYQQSLRDAGDTAKADKVLADINPK